MSILDSVFASVTGNNNLDLSENEIIATAEEAAEAIVEREIAEAEKDVAVIEKEVESQEVAIEALEEKVEELEEIIDGQESMLNGDTPFNAGLFHDRQVRGAKILARMGAQVEVGGVESYSDASTANLAAFEGVEKFKEVAGQALAQAKKFFIDLYNSFINLFVGLFNKLKGIKGKAVQMKAKLNAAENVKDKPSLGKSASLLDANGTTTIVSKLVAVGTKIGSSMGGVYTGTADSAAGVVHSIAETLAAAGSGKTVEGKNDDSETLVTSVGSSAKLKVVAPTKDSGIGKVKVTLTLGEAPAAASVGKPALLSILTSVASNADQLQNSKLDKGALTAQRDRAVGQIAQYSASAGGDDKDAQKEAKKEGKTGAAAVKSSHQAALKLGKGATDVGASVLAAQLEFVNAHLGGKAPKDQGKKDEGKKD